MGQKVNPHGLRVGVIKDWESRWFADDENFSDNLVEDYKIREFLKKFWYIQQNQVLLSVKAALKSRS